jgi:hypothetical protein
MRRGWRKLYVDSVSGSDSYRGSQAAPKLTLAGAISALGTLHKGMIYVKAPSTTPLRAQVTPGLAQELRIQPWPGVANFYWYGSTKVTSGWTDAGGGLYTRAATTEPLVVALPTLLNGSGFWTRLTRNTGTPTTPAAGEFGHAANVLYVHLPADASANSHTIEYGQRDYCWLNSSYHRVTLVGAVLRCSNAIGACVYAPAAGSGELICINCTSQYHGSSGFGCDNGAKLLTCDTCTAQCNGNDGFNVHGTATPATRAVTRNCLGSYNDDEGSSPHETTVLDDFYSIYEYNLSSDTGGMGAVGSAVMNCYGTISRHNARGLAWAAAGNSGYCHDCTCSDNTGPGVYTKAGSSVTFVNLTSGVAAGNGLADALDQ